MALSIILCARSYRWVFPFHLYDLAHRITDKATGSTPHKGSASPHPPFHHLHMQPRRGQIHRRQAHIPRRHTHLIIRPDLTIQHKGDAALLGQNALTQPTHGASENFLVGQSALA